MSRFMSVVWVIQFFALLALSAVLLVSPQVVPELLDHCTNGDNADGNERLYDLSDIDKPPVERKECGQNPPKSEKSHRQWMEVRFVLASGRLMVPFTFLLAIFSLHAFMREDLRVRRRLARIFALTGFLLVYFMLFPPQPHGSTDVQSDIASCTQGATGGITRCAGEYVTKSFTPSSTDQNALLGIFNQDHQNRGFLHALLAGCFAFLVFLVMSNLMLAFWPLPRDARRLSGSADTRPSWLWLLWLSQGFFFTLSALFLSAVQVARWVLADTSFTPLETDDFHYANVLNDFHQLSPPLFLSVGLLSFAGMRASREWGWRAFSRLFVLFYGVWFLTLLFVWDTRFNPLILLFLLPMLLLFLGNLRFWHRSDIWFAEEVGEGPDGWIAADLIIGVLLMWRTIFTQRRALYSRGVACWGTFHVADYQYDFTYGRSLAHDFFPTRQRFEAQVRFSTEGPDEAALAMRGVALQLDTPERGSFDLLLGTGAYSPAENIVQFVQLYLARILGGFAERMFWRSHPRMREGLIAALRRAPDSYTKLHYHSQTVRFWVARDGTRHLVRYRLVPDESVPSEESGLPKPREGAELVLERRRSPDERRPSDYLKQELKQRLEGSRSCTLRLEAQFHGPDPGDSTHWFNPSVDWRTDEHPWIILGHLALEEIIPDEQSERLCFNPANVPPSLGTPISGGLFDYRSIADSEKRVHRRIQKTRQWMAETFGLPSLDSRPHDPT